MALGTIELLMEEAKERPRYFVLSSTLFKMNFNNNKSLSRKFNTGLFLRLPQKLSESFFNNRRRIRWCSKQLPQQL